MSYRSYINDSVMPTLGSPFFEEHLARYVFAEKIIQGKTVLELGCGHGYGARLLARSADRVIGCDLNQTSLDFARTHYVAPNLKFLTSDVTSPLAEGPFDVIICFEVLEHITAVDASTLLNAIKDNLKSDGMLLLSTPNHDVVLRSGMPVPEFHINNLRAQELRELLSLHFDRVTLLGQTVKKGALADLIFYLDIFNLRHSPLLRTLRRRITPVSTLTPKAAPEIWNLNHGFGRATEYHFSRHLWRQAGMTLALCTKKINALGN